MFALLVPFINLDQKNAEKIIIGPHLIVQSWLLRSEHQTQFRLTLAMWPTPACPACRRAVDIETQAVQAQLQFIARSPPSALHGPQAAGGQVFEAGNSETAQQGDTQHPHLRAARHQVLGVLHLSRQPAATFGKDCRPKALRILLGYSALTASICALIAFMPQLLQKPLSTVAGFASELIPHQLTTPSRAPANRAPQPHSDEIDLLEQGVVKLQTALHQHIHNLDDLVNERTAELEAAGKRYGTCSVHRWPDRPLQPACAARQAARGNRTRRSDTTARWLVAFMDIDHFSSSTTSTVTSWAMKSCSAESMSPARCAKA